jgi:hypothetical protein
MCWKCDFAANMSERVTGFIQFMELCRTEELDFSVLNAV